MRIFFSLLIKSAVAALFLFFAGASVAQQATFSREELLIKSGGVTHKFTVELALTDEQRMQGLMFRKEMAPDAGMLFDFGESRRVQMWMENTILPLDMLFIQNDGRISHIKEGAVPFSRDIIDSRSPVHFVLELNAGRVKELGIKIGDHVISKQIGNTTATNP
jgi:uncharacterized membrane protein (UPF0127 family)